MKYIFFLIIIVLAALIGLLLGLGLLEGLGFIIGVFILFPTAYIFGIVFLGKGKKDIDEHEDENTEDKFYKWD